MNSYYQIIIIIIIIIIIKICWVHQFHLFGVQGAYTCYNSKENLNKWFFSFDLKTSSIGNDLISHGNLFHSEGAAITKEQSPPVTSLEHASHLKVWHFNQTKTKCWDGFEAN